MRWIVVLVLLVTACGGSISTSEPAAPAPTSIPAATTTAASPPETAGISVAPCADVVGVSAEQSADGAWRISATVSSGDTGWDKYADLWEVYVDGEKVAERVLAHPHETEQPFTRSTSGVMLPEGTTAIEVAARDSVNGFCGEAFVLDLPQ